MLDLSESERKDLLESFQTVEKNLDFFVHRFYHYFFQTDAKLLFRDTQMEKQFVMFGESLDLIISQLFNPDELSKTLKKITFTHNKHGVRAEHIPYFIDAFMMALKEVLNEKYQENLLDLWSELLISLMEYFTDDLEKDKLE